MITHMDNIRLSNFWLRKRREPDLLRIVSWAQSHSKKIHELDSANIRAALETRWVISQYDED